jgi:hypothetical protein
MRRAHPGGARARRGAARRFAPCARLARHLRIRLVTVQRCRHARSLASSRRPPFSTLRLARPQAQLRALPAGAAPRAGSQVTLEALFNAAARERVYAGRKGRVPKAALRPMLLRFADGADDSAAATAILAALPAITDNLVSFRELASAVRKVAGVRASRIRAAVFFAPPRATFARAQLPRAPRTPHAAPPRRRAAAA